MGDASAVADVDPRNSSEDQAGNERVEWAIKLFRKSPLKQEKWRQIQRCLLPVGEYRSLDIGSDNGVISLLLRQRGGQWFSADLIAETVDSIQQLVGEHVYQIDGKRTPFDDNSFEQVVIVDFLEHIETDALFIDELFRIIKPGGRLVINVPNPREGLLRRLRFALGQTDQAHGHVRAGYSLPQLRSLCKGRFEVNQGTGYSKLFSELIDTVITAALEFLKGGGRGQKGTVVTGADMSRLKKSFTIYRAVYPLVASFVFLDNVLPLMRGSMLICICQSVKSKN